jgi:hypothetical protein
MLCLTPPLLKTGLATGVTGSHDPFIARSSCSGSGAHGTAASGQTSFMDSVV